MSATIVDNLDPNPVATDSTPPATTTVEVPDKPRIRLPGPDRMVSEFAEELGRHLSPTLAWFVHHNRVVTVGPRHLGRTGSGLVMRAMDASSARTAIERFVQPGHEHHDRSGQVQFTCQTASRECTQAVLDSEQLKAQLPLLDRLLDLPVPLLHEGRIMYLQPGYDPRFCTYCPADSVQPEPQSLEDAKQVLEEFHSDFCFVDATAKTMAIARMLTPYCRGLMGFSARPPVWMFEGNRPRAGKDYLAGCTSVLFTGEFNEEAPLSGTGEETTKRILAAAQAGRRFMHFANCKGHIDDRGFEQTTTAKVLGGRLLGRNDAAASLSVPNEVEFSLSANTGLSYSEDLSLRLRKISLSFLQEDANSRRFFRPDLHGWIRDNRARILGALAALIRHWDENGRPEGTPFASFPEWARVVGGIMVCCGLGDPCVSQIQQGLTVDDGTEQMGLLFRLIHREHRENWISKRELLALVDQLAEGDAFSWFDPLNRSHQTKFGKELVRFNGRELGGLRLAMDRTDPSRPRFRVLPAGNSSSEGSSLRTCEHPAPRSAVAPGQQKPNFQPVCEPGEPCEPFSEVLRFGSGSGMMFLPADDAVNRRLEEPSEVRKVRNVRNAESPETIRDRLSRTNPVREQSEAFSA